MMYTLRSYQKAASDSVVNAFTCGRGDNGIVILPTGAGKSLVIADIASKIDAPLLVFQPSKEILEQNFAKLQSYGIIDCDVYSASVRRKQISRITFATIGSVIRHMEDFNHFKYVLIDECHLVKPSDGMYKKFLTATKRQVIGLTATPYRLYNNINGSQLRFITRTRPRIFNKVLYYCQVSELLAKGFLAQLNYYDVTSLNFDNVRSNSTGADYDDKSLVREYQRSGFYDKLVSLTKRLLKPKSGIPRKGILVFTRFTDEAYKLKNAIDGVEVVSADTTKADREQILQRFKRGEIKVIANVGVLTTGFDYPELDTVLLARPTKSLSLYYQMVGRAIRPCEGKCGWIVDMAGNYKRFGKVEDLRVANLGSEKWVVMTNGKILTNTYFQ